MGRRGDGDELVDIRWRCVHLLEGILGRDIGYGPSQIIVNLFLAF